MSTDLIVTLNLAAGLVTVYAGFFVFFAGMIGNILNIIVFTSLKTFRETSSAFYLTVFSSTNVVQLIVSLLSRILITGFNLDPTRTSHFICKTREYLVTTLMLYAFTCMCFAVIDQYLSLTDRWHHLCTTRVARWLVIIAFFVCFLHSIPCSLYYDHIVSTTTSQISCSIVNRTYGLYYSKFLFPMLLGFIPLIIRSFFGLLAFRAVRQMDKRREPIVRVERDKQLTKMVLVEVVAGVLLTVSYSVYNHLYSSNAILTTDYEKAVNGLLISIFRIFFYGNFAISFYIYFCVSSRFRKQLIYVLFQIHFKRFRQQTNRSLTNQVTPQSLDVHEIC